MDHYLHSNLAPQIVKELEICLLSFRADQTGEPDPGHAIQYFVYDELPLNEQAHLLEAMRFTTRDIRNGAADHPFWEEASFKYKSAFVEVTEELVTFMERSYAKSLEDAG